MATTIANLQTRIRFEARDDDLDFATDDSASPTTPTDNRQILNMNYRRVVMLLRSYELYDEDVTIPTVDAQAAYTWPTGKTFWDVISVEIQNPAKNLKYKLVPKIEDMAEFAEHRARKDGFPLGYRRSSSSGTDQIVFAPAPNFVGTIRISGLIEPTDLLYTGGSPSTTVFVSTLADDALVYLTAATFANKRNFPTRAQILKQKAAEVLSAVAGREISLAEIFDGGANQQNVN